MSFGCYQPDVHTNLGCRPTASSMGLKETRLFQQKVRHETRNPITGEVICYGKHQTASSSSASSGTGGAGRSKHMSSDIFNTQSSGEDGAFSSTAEPSGGKKQMPEQRHHENLRKNLTLAPDARDGNREVSRVAEGNLTVGSMLPAAYADTRDFGLHQDSDGASSYFTKSKLSHAGGDCGGYIKPRDSLGPGLHPVLEHNTAPDAAYLLGHSQRRANDFRTTNSYGQQAGARNEGLENARRIHIRATEHGYMPEEPLRDANVERIAHHILNEVPSAKYYDVFRD
mmetsp:Transcript_17657/g.44063  ORF Transcript_17657/g.44063 Transcript_17657/m.44063 type:complete len:284 (+) Transcript_17657:167-1018(+)|eukprot:CAMPEP_0178998054 /NCGR_PEP_ID=MMETSP0795-20121207/9316_1 /TAXON_ID=88552 /ORGANISM="Amoebophrya sp., Strain Ameob2" /LENGTH=283 /DNA_ID=CAMNT_0020690723 /DNA_START=80 /DNA_END=931 /DNA_ORIENTATION=+